MTDREKVINCLTDIEQIMVCRQEICPREELQYWIELQEGVADALALLKEQEEKLKFLDALYNYINPNDMEQYMQMYKSLPVPSDGRSVK